MQARPFRFLAGTVALTCLAPLVADARPGVSAQITRAAREAATTQSLLTNGSFENIGASWYAPWRLQVLGTGQATLAQDTATAADGHYSAAITVYHATSTQPAYIALLQGNLSLVAGTTYTVSFWAKSSQPFSIDAGVQQAFFPYQWPALGSYTLGKTWQQYSFSFVAHATESPMKLQFNLGASTGTVWIDGVSLTDPVGSPAATATATAVPPTGTATRTAVPPSATASRTSVPPSSTGTPTATTVPPTATATGTAVATSNPLPVGQTGAWTMIFDDEFNASSLDLTKWQPNWYGATTTAVTQPVNSYETECYDPKQVTEGNGELDLRAIASSCTTSDGITRPYRSGLVSTEGKYTFTYGYAEARMWTPAGTGMWPAFWSVGETWPQDGEIDALEADGTNMGSYHYHYPGGGPGGDVSVPGATSGWHTYATDWEPGVIRWYYDGNLVWTLSNTDLVGGYSITSSPQHLILDLALDSSSAAVPATLRVDYVRVWQKG